MSDDRDSYGDLQRRNAFLERQLSELRQVLAFGDKAVDLSGKLINAEEQLAEARRDVECLQSKLVAATLGQTRCNQRVTELEHERNNLVNLLVTRADTQRRKEASWSLDDWLDATDKRVTVIGDHARAEVLLHLFAVTLSILVHHLPTDRTQRIIDSLTRHGLFAGLLLAAKTAGLPPDTMSIWARKRQLSRQSGAASSGDEGNESHESGISQ